MNCSRADPTDYNRRVIVGLVSFMASLSVSSRFSSFAKRAGALEGALKWENLQMCSDLAPVVEYVLRTLPNDASGSQRVTENVLTRRMSGIALARGACQVILLVLRIGQVLHFGVSVYGGVGALYKSRLRSFVVIPLFVPLLFLCLFEEDRVKAHPPFSRMSCLFALGGLFHDVATEEGKRVFSCIFVLDLFVLLLGMRSSVPAFAQWERRLALLVGVSLIQKLASYKGEGFVLLRPWLSRFINFLAAFQGSKERRLTSFLELGKMNGRVTLFLNPMLCPVRMYPAYFFIYLFSLVVEAFLQPATA